MKLLAKNDGVCDVVRIDCWEMKGQKDNGTEIASENTGHQNNLHKIASVLVAG